MVDETHAKLETKIKELTEENTKLKSGGGCGTLGLSSETKNFQPLHMPRQQNENKILLEKIEKLETKNNELFQDITKIKNAGGCCACGLAELKQMLEKHYTVENRIKEMQRHLDDVCKRVTAIEEKDMQIYKVLSTT
jgi:seryl-tRNA synthetase